ncbi:MAG TPA: YdeI/OmpD-associated family protein [Flavisolibacter sp.]|jgi:hypothetical protein|nr:YdeI/OmpD-associated family protein [Flavisolibacter sp.]
MPSTIAQKLKIKEGYTLLTKNAPAGFDRKIEGLPSGVKVTSKAVRFNQVHWFVTDQVQLKKELSGILPLVQGDVVCWIYYPKGSSGQQTDLTRDKGWDVLLKHSEMQWISLISFDDTWSAFGMRLKTEKDASKEAKPKENPVRDYIDPVKKTVTLPKDLLTTLKKEPESLAYFDSLAYSHKKEYVEWIVSAKKEETRQARMVKMQEMLSRKLKNPSQR